MAGQLESAGARTLLAAPSQLPSCPQYLEGVRGQNSVLLSLSQRSCLQCQVGEGPAAQSSPLRCNRADLRLRWHLRV